MIVDDTNIGVVLKVDFSFEVPLDAGIALTGVERLELLFHMLVKWHSNIADIQITINFLNMGNLSNLSIGELNGEVDPERGEFSSSCFLFAIFWKDENEVFLVSFETEVF